MIPIEIVGTGVYAPGQPISNQELKKLAHIDFDAEKLENKLGIFQRHIAHLRHINETTADFATKAAAKAIENAGVDPQDVDLFVVGTDTPEFITPATAILVQGRIQKKESWSAAFDVSASCASFVIAFDTAIARMAIDSSISCAVVVGVYNMPAFVRPGDSFGYSIFADGAGAIVLKRSTGKPSRYLASQVLTDGTQWDYIGVYAGGTRNPVTPELLAQNKHGLLNLQPLPGDRNLRLWPLLVQKLISKTGFSINDIDHFIFTQINKSVILKVMQELNQPIEKAGFVMDRYGYTGSACIPMAFHHSIKEGKIKHGDKVMCVASGAGLSVAGSFFIY